MKHIEGLLLKLQSAFQGKKSKQRIISEVIQNKTGISVPADQINIQGKQVFLLNISPIKKNEIFFKQKEILSEAKDRSGVYFSNLQ